MAQPRWCVEFPWFPDHREFGLEPKTCYSTPVADLLGMLSESLNTKENPEPEYQQDSVLAAWGGMSQYVYHKTGCPKLYAPTAIAELLRRSNIGEDIRLGDLKFPHDVFCVVLERDFEIVPGIPLTAVKMTNLRSRLARSLANELIDEAVTEKLGLRNKTPETTKKILATFESHFEKMTARVLVEFDICKGEERKIVRFFMGLSSSIAELMARVPGEHDLEEKLVKFAAAILLRNHCRPETVVPFSIPRSERYQHKGNRDSFRIMTYPWKKTVRTGPSDEQRQALGMLERETRKVKAHVRGFVYRTLRDERFKRNPDGTPRIIEIEPCLVHPEEFELEDR